MEESSNARDRHRGRRGASAAGIWQPADRRSHRSQANPPAGAPSRACTRTRLLQVPRGRAAREPLAANTVDQSRASPSPREARTSAVLFLAHRRMPRHRLLGLGEQPLRDWCVVGRSGSGQEGRRVLPRAGHRRGRCAPAADSSNHDGGSDPQRASSDRARASASHARDARNETPHSAFESPLSLSLDHHRVKVVVLDRQFDDPKVVSFRRTYGRLQRSMDAFAAEPREPLCDSKRDMHRMSKIVLRPLLPTARRLRAFRPRAGGSGKANCTSLVRSPVSRVGPTSMARELLTIVTNRAVSTVVIYFC